MMNWGINTEFIPFAFFTGMCIGLLIGYIACMKNDISEDK